MVHMKIAFLIQFCTNPSKIESNIKTMVRWLRPVEFVLPLEETNCLIRLGGTEFTNILSINVSKNLNFGFYKSTISNLLSKRSQGFVHELPSRKTSPPFAWRVTVTKYLKFLENHIRSGHCNIKLNSKWHERM